MTKRTRKTAAKPAKGSRTARSHGWAGYDDLVGGIADLLKHARRTSARAGNAFMTATYCNIGRRVVEFEKRGKVRAEYRKSPLETLSADLPGRFGRGFSRQSLQQMRQFYLLYLPESIRQTVSGEIQPQDGSAITSQISGCELQMSSTTSSVAPLSATLEQTRQMLEQRGTLENSKR